MGIVPHIRAVTTLALVMVFPLSAAACSIVTQKQSPQFEYVVVDHAGPQAPWGKSIGDLNGDGLVDLIVGGAESNELVWYQNPSWSRFPLASGAAFGTDHEVADVDGDGRQDLVSLQDGQLVWYRNPAWDETVIDRLSFHDIELADLDGDGDVDVVARDQSTLSEGNDTIFAYQQESPGQWTRFRISNLPGEGLKLADVDNDGKIDVVVNRMWFDNPGVIGDEEWRPRTYQDSWTWQRTYIDVGDIDGDGRPDIVATPSEFAGQYYRISWFEAPTSPAASWKEHVIEHDVEAVHHFVGVVDMNNDGRQDVVVAEMHQGEDPDEIRIYLNVDDGSNWTPLVVASTGSHSMRIADFDNDGDFDLFGANWSGDHQLVELWMNQTCDSFERD